MSKRRKKRRLPAPPLSTIDKITYFILFLFVCLLMLSFVYLMLFWQRHKVFSDTNVLAYENSASSLWILVPFIALIVPAIGIFDMMWLNKQPIWGNRNIRYGISSKYRAIYPVFGKQRRKQKKTLTPNKKSIRNMTIIIILSFYVITLIFGFFGLFGRNELTSTSITKFNVFNQISKEYSLDNITSYNVRAYYDTKYRYKLGHYTFAIELVVENGNKYFFKYSQFRNINAMKQIDTRLNKCHKNVEGIENLEKVFDYYKFNDIDKAAVYDLFELQ